MAPGFRRHFALTAVTSKVFEIIESYTNKRIFIDLADNIYSYSQKYFAFLKYINFKEKMLREGIILQYFSYILINITRRAQK